MQKLNPKYMNFALIRGPLDRITAATGGIMRADGNGAMVGEDAMQPDMRAVRPDGRYGLRHYALVAPVGDAVLVEFCYMHNIPRGLTLMLPELEVLSFRSNWETKTRGYDQFKVYQGGEVIRMVDVEQGWETTRLTVAEEGEPHDLEPEKWPRSKRKWLDQEALLVMAERAIPGCRKMIVERDLQSVTSFAAYSSLDAWRDDLAKERTALFQAEYEAARRLGIGKPEKGRKEMQSQNDWLDHAEAVGDYLNQFISAVSKARPDPVKVCQAYDALLSDPARPEGIVLTSDLLTGGLDRAGDRKALSYLDAQAKIWKQALDLNGRILQTIWAKPEYADFSLAETDDVPVRSVCGLNAGTYADIDEAVRHEASKALKASGVTFDPTDDVFSKIRSVLAMAGHLFTGGNDFKKSVNSDITSDLFIGKPNKKK